jgi:hypothetical protein
MKSIGGKDLKTEIKALFGEARPTLTDGRQGNQCKKS